MLPLLIFATLLSAALARTRIQKGADGTIPDKYIVKLKDSSGTVSDLGLKAKPDFEYSWKGFHGFAGRLTKDEVKKLTATGKVDYVDPDYVVKQKEFVGQKGAPWGLARISHRFAGSNKYVYDESAGKDTCAYVIDGGIMVDHPEFGGRAKFLKDFTDENELVDKNGHGTHVAGIIGSKTYGVAKNVELYAIKVMNSRGSGSTSTIIRSIQYVLKDAEERRHNGMCSKGIVVNFSIASLRNRAYNSAAAALTASGMFVVAGAGNEDMDTKYFSPASEPMVCTVGATDSNDHRAYFSNYGPDVDIFAPGTGIVSTFNDGKIEISSGTSFAAPYVTGLGAYLLGLGKPSTDLCKTIQEMSTKNAIAFDTLPQGTKNYLAFNGATSCGKCIKRWWGKTTKKTGETAKKYAAWIAKKQKEWAASMKNQWNALQKKEYSGRSNEEIVKIKKEWFAKKQQEFTAQMKKEWAALQKKEGAPNKQEGAPPNQAGAPPNQEGATQKKKEGAPLRKRYAPETRPSNVEE